MLSAPETALNAASFLMGENSPSTPHGMALTLVPATRRCSMICVFEYSESVMTCAALRTAAINTGRA